MIQSSTLSSSHPTTAPIFIPAAYLSTSPTVSFTQSSGYIDDALLYTYYSIIKNITFNTQKLQSVLFSSFVNKSTDVNNNICNEWISLLGGALALSSPQYYYSTWKFNFGYEDLLTRKISLTSFNCSDAASIASILKAIQVQLRSSTSKNLQYSCNGNNWQIFSCGGQVSVCVNCNFKCSCPSTQAFYLMSPCNSRCPISLTSSYYISTLTLASRKLAPDIFIHSINPAQSDLVVYFNVSFSGTVYCSALPQGTMLSSTVSVRSSGYSQLAINSGITYTLTVFGLTPSTNYDVYCNSESLSGYGMDLTSTLATRLSITTLCCHQISFIKKYTAITTQSTDAFILGLDAAPSATTTIDIILQPTNLCGTNYSAALSAARAQPSSFVVKPGSSSLTFSFIVSGSPGCYVITAFALGSQRYQNASTSLVILGNNEVAPPPKISSVEFDSDGFEMIVYFDSATDYGSTIIENAFTSSFSCSLLLNFKGSIYASCFWYSNQILIAQLYGVIGALGVGDTVTLVSNAVKAATASQGVSVKAPAGGRATSLYVSLSMASAIGRCNDLTVDPTASYGSGGRPWSVQWLTSGSVDYGYVTTYLNKNYKNINSTITIPRCLLQDGSLTITLILTNFFGESGAASKTVIISQDDSSPVLTVYSASQSLIRSWTSLFIIADAYLPSCLGGKSNLSVPLVYSWKMYLNGVCLPAITSRSNNPRYFKLAPYTLTLLQTYELQVTVTSALTGDYAVDSMIISVVKSNIVAIIKGGTTRSVSIHHQLVLDASESYDMDSSSSNSDHLSYKWLCYISSEENYGESCNIDLQNKSELSLPPRTLATHSYNITVIVAAADGRSAFASTLVAIVSDSVPYVATYTINSLEDGRNVVRYNSNDKIVLNGYLNASSAVTLTWSCLLCPYNLATASSTTPLQTTFPFGFETLFPLSLSPKFLLNGRTYTFQLTATYEHNNISAYSTITFTTNNAPLGGSLLVSPLEGTTLTTIFTLSAIGWVDKQENYPLAYAFSYYTSSSSPYYLLRSSSIIQYVDIMLSQGLLSRDYAVICVVSVSDTLGAASETSAKVRVVPYSFNYDIVSISTINQFLQNSVEEGAFNYDYDFVLAAIRAGVTSILYGNCSLAPNCTAIHRLDCSLISHTCGSCQEGYLGILGPSNVPCQRMTSLRASGGICASDSVCLSHNCQHGRCTVAPKVCPNNCTMHGRCQIYNFNGEEASFCDSFSLYCHSRCICSDGWYGLDCSQTIQTFRSLGNSVDILCYTLSSLLAYQVR